ncbi:MAG: ASCH domain-containing protein [Clostridiales bacterium]|nr:ASCH domain-containing protein [Clostridiales bacterium]
MSLVPSAFDTIATGKKTVEMRLCDEKRKKLKVGDEIEFENTETRRAIRCEVVGLFRYKDFFELYSAFDKTAIGYGETDTASATDMYAYYSPEQIEKYGALAIEIRLI